MPNLREESRRQYGSVGNSPTTTELQVGAILRIADAVEKISEDQVQKDKSLKFYKELSESRYHEIERLKRQLAGTRAVVTRLKNGKATN